MEGCAQFRKDLGQGIDLQLLLQQISPLEGLKHLEAPQPTYPTPQASQPELGGPQGSIRGTTAPLPMLRPAAERDMVMNARSERTVSIMARTAGILTT